MLTNTLLIIKGMYAAQLGFTNMLYGSEFCSLDVLDIDNISVMNQQEIQVVSSFLSILYCLFLIVYFRGCVT